MGCKLLIKKLLSWKKDCHIEIFISGIRSPVSERQPHFAMWLCCDEKDLHQGFYLPTVSLPAWAFFLKLWDPPNFPWIVELLFAL